MNDNNFKDPFDFLKEYTKNISVLLQAFSIAISDIQINIIDTLKPLFEVLSSLGQLSDKDKAILDVLVEYNIVYWGEINENKENEILKRNDMFLNRLLYDDNPLGFDYKNSEIIINKKVFKQCLDAYNSCKYELCSIGLFSIVDGMLSYYSDDKQCVKAKERIDKVKSKIEQYKIVMPKSIQYITYTFVPISLKLFAKSDFNKKEPNLINRHWTVHGRSNKENTKEECLILFRVINALNQLHIFIRNINEEIEENIKNNG